MLASIEQTVSPRESRVRFVHSTAPAVGEALCNLPEKYGCDAIVLGGTPPAEKRLRRWVGEYIARDVVSRARMSVFVIRDPDKRRLIPQSRLDGRRWGRDAAARIRAVHPWDRMEERAEDMVVKETGDL